MYVYSSIQILKAQSHFFPDPESVFAYLGSVRVRVRDRVSG